MRFQPKFLSSDTPLAEYPRPQFCRESYLSLNGVWEYAITGTVVPPERYDGRIVVPYPPESSASGVVRQPSNTEYLHYRRAFTLPREFFRGRVLLNVGACDQVCEVFCNGVRIGAHEGGYLPFALELTDALSDGENVLTFVVQDDASSEIYGRGKQSYRRGGIWYTATSGLWQSVWLESVPKEYIKGLKLLPDYDQKTLFVDCDAPQEVVVSVYDGEKRLAEGKTEQGKLILNVSECLPWSPQSPELYRLKLAMGEDRVESYFGLRKFSAVERDGKKYFAVNNRPIFQNGLLDQGYWKEGICTPPSNLAMFEELRTVKELGYNMLRKHIKVESALWYYYCDVLGILVWQDMLNGGGAYSWLRIHLCPFVDLHINDTNYRGMKRQNARSREWFLREARDTIGTLFNCVSLYLWTPFNEAWGQFDAVKVWKLLRQEDSSRLYDHASGWQDKGGGDVYSRHIYFRKIKLKNDGKRVLALTEFGGYSYAVKGHTFTEKSFGYKGFRSEEELTRAFERLYRTEIIPAIGTAGLSAAVYTQLTDIEDEINGLFTYDRILKFPAERLQKLNEEVYAAFRHCLTDEVLPHGRVGG